MGDSSSFTQEARNQFNKNHANLLNNKHTTTVKNIQDLQELEKYMFNNLQTLNRSGANSAQEAELIKKRINELSAMRLTLFRNLKTMYKDTQKQTHHNRSNLADQITMTKVVENELDNAKKQLTILEQDKLNKKRLAEWSDTDNIPLGSETRKYFERNKKLIDLSMIPKEISESIINRYKDCKDNNRSLLLQYFIDNKLKALIENINDF